MCECGRGGGGGLMDEIVMYVCSMYVHRKIMSQ